MKKLEKKGFTLIELLAVIVILGVLLAIAIPSVSKYISESRKRTYVANAQSYVEAVKGETYIGNQIPFPVQHNEATLVTFSRLRQLLEKGGKQSPYGGDFDLLTSFVLIVNINDAETPLYKYYIAAIDDNGYGIGNDAGAKAVEYDSLKIENIIQLGAGNGVSIPGDNKLPVIGDKADEKINITATITKYCDETECR